MRFADTRNGYRILSETLSKVSDYVVSLEGKETIKEYLCQRVDALCLLNIIYRILTKTPLDLSL